jgi:hypothetical protein
VSRAERDLGFGWERRQLRRSIGFTEPEADFVVEFSGRRNPAIVVVASRRDGKNLSKPWMLDTASKRQFAIAQRLESAFAQNRIAVIRIDRTVWSYFRLLFLAVNVTRTGTLTGLLARKSTSCRTK